jgi:branched-chain amino acid transport system ATP-binding protein/nonpolar-amino-acid-transporting ATPase
MPKPVAGGDALSIDRISHAFQGLVALRDVELNVRAGTIAALIGPNGSGKTTLFNIVSGFLHPKHGRVLYCGREITQDPVDVRSRAGLVRTFQTPRVFERLSTFENLMAGAYKLAGSRTPEDLLRLPASSRKRSQIEALAESACRDFGLDQVAWAAAGSLPPGQKRMLELARACVGQPRLLLLDEPSAGLNSDEIAHLKKTLCRVAASGVTILLVSHDMSVVSVATSVNVLYYGTIIARGTMEEIQGNAQVREAYLGLP